MLCVPASYVAALLDHRIDTLARRLAPWLARMLPGRPAVDGRDDYRELRELCHAARAIGMDVETDYAVFAHLMISRGGNWRALLDAPETRAVMSRPDLHARSKLLWLEARISGQRK